MSLTKKFKDIVKSKFPESPTAIKSSCGDNLSGSHGWKTWVIFWILLATTTITTILAGGLFFSLSLLLILGTHEFGHYWASRKNDVPASLPYFMPAPPVFIAGTFGAFIRIDDSIPDRRVLIEIGSAGPIAGFFVAVPTLIIGLHLSEVEPTQGLVGVSYGSSLLLTLLSEIILGVSPSAENINIILHPIAFAGWIGLFVTALNLLPIGQLDGGHIIYALFTRRFVHLSWVFFVILIPMGLFWNGWWFWALLVIAIGFQHAPVMDESVPLESRHRWLGYISIIIFLVTFIPVPFEFLTY